MSKPTRLASLAAFAGAVCLFVSFCPALSSAAVVTSSTDWEADFSAGGVTVELESDVSLSIVQHMARAGTFDFQGNGHTLTLTASNQWCRFADWGGSYGSGNVTWNQRSGTIVLDGTHSARRLQFAREGYSATVNLYGGTFHINFPTGGTLIGTHSLNPNTTQGTFNFYGGDLRANGFTFVDGNTAAHGGVFNFFSEHSGSNLILTGDQQAYLQNLVSGGINKGAVYLDGNLASAASLPDWDIFYDGGQNLTYLTLALAELQSALTGYWDQGTSWTTGAVPTAADSPQIVSGHTITVRNPGAVADALTVKEQGTRLVVATGADLALGGSLLLREGGGADIAGTLTAKSLVATQGEVSLQGRLELAEASSFRGLNISGPSAVLQNAAAANVEILRMSSDAAFTKAGAGAMSVAKLAAEGNNAITAQAGSITFAQGEKFANVASLNLAGGTVAITSAFDTVGGLRQYYNDGANLAGTISNAATYINTVAADGTISTLLSNRTWDAGFVQVDDRITRNGGATNFLFNNNSNISGWNNFTYVWTGYFTPDATEEYTMALSSIDDAGAFCIDINGDGVFSADEVVTALYSGGFGSGSKSFGTLTEGETYAVMMAFGEASGGEVWKFELNGQVPMTADDTTGTWTAPLDTYSAGDYSHMDVNVSQSSTLELNAGAGTAFKGLDIAADKKLTMAGTATDFGVGRLTTGAGRAEMDFTGGRLRVLNSLSPGGDAAIGTFALTGDLELAAGSEFTINITDDSAGGFLNDQLEIDGDFFLPASGEEAVKLLVSYDGTGNIDVNDEFLLATITGTADGDLDHYEIFFGGLDIAGAELKWEDIASGGSELYLTGLSGSGGTSGSSVPEPVTWLMLLLGSVVLFARRRFL